LRNLPTWRTCSFASDSFSWYGGGVGLFLQPLFRLQQLHQQKSMVARVRCQRDTCPTCCSCSAPYSTSTFLPHNVHENLSLRSSSSSRERLRQHSMPYPSPCSTQGTTSSVSHRLRTAPWHQRSIAQRRRSKQRHPVSISGDRKRKNLHRRRVGTFSSSAVTRTRNWFFPIAVEEGRSTVESVAAAVGGRARPEQP
jgi:hypothetical protein